MHKFLKKVLGYLAGLYLIYLFLIALISLVFIGSKLVFHHDKGNFANEYNRAFNTKDADILVLGSSRAAASLNSKKITNQLGSKCYNLSFNQSNLTYSYHLLQYYLNEAKKNPRHIILELSWFSFDSNRLSYKEYASYFIFNKPILFYKEILLNKRNHIWNGLLTLGRALERNDKVYVDFDAKKKKIKPQNPNRKDYDFDSNALGFKKTFPNGHAKMVEEEMHSLTNIITLLENKNISLILYTSPEDLNFSNAQLNREDVFTYIDSMCKDCIWLDYSPGGNLYSKNYENVLNDSHHVYFKDIFTEIFIDDLKKLEIK